MSLKLCKENLIDLSDDEKIQLIIYNVHWKLLLIILLFLMRICGRIINAKFV